MILKTLSFYSHLVPWITYAIIFYAIIEIIFYKFQKIIAYAIQLTKWLKNEVFSKSFTYAAEFNKLFLSMMIIIILVVYFIIILFSLLSFYGEECASLPAKGRCLLAVHVEKSFPNLNKSNRTQIVFTMQRLIWNSKRTASVCCSKSVGKL